MIRGHSRSGKRSAFTLVELMVVILIIAILVSMISSAALKAMGKIPEVQTRTEISQLSVAMQAFMADYNITDPPPSYLFLNENNYLLTPDQGLSGVFLQKLFGKNLSVQVDWNGNGIIDGPPQGWVLEGEQCLVFYLGGIPNTAAVNTALLSNTPAVTECLGFSTNSMNPASPSVKRKGPYYPFQSGQLAPSPTGPIPAGRLLPGSVANPALSGFYVYFDPWQVKSTLAGGPHLLGWPYAYFSSQGNNNSGYMMNSISLGRDCLSIGAKQYWTAQAGAVPTAFTNSNTYQIISAGKNGAFGGGLWSPTGGAASPGDDDQANFSSTLLGNGQN